MTTSITIVTCQASTAEPAGSPPTPAVGQPGNRPMRSVGADVHRDGRGVRPNVGAAVEHLLRRRADLPPGHPDRPVLRERAIESGLPLARSLAARYRDRGEPLDDLSQVAAIGLIKAVDGYDPARSVPFVVYAVPTITGVLKHHFRDTTWRIRVPRRVQELALSLAPGNAELSQRLGRSPTRTELAAHLGAAKHDVVAASFAWAAHRPLSLDGFAANGDREQTALLDVLGSTDAHFDDVTDEHVWQQLLDRLPPGERRILAMRFGQQLTQSEIAAHVGVSQMQISRLLLRSLTRLRTGARPTAARRLPTAAAGTEPAPERNARRPTRAGSVRTRNRRQELSRAHAMSTKPWKGSAETQVTGSAPHR
jgi:RNA polymerase sigma-B factor